MEKEQELINLRRTRTKYDNNFKEAAIRKVIENPSRTFQSIGTELGVSYHLLYSWYSRYKSQSDSAKAVPSIKVLDDQQLFWVRETIGSSEKDKIKYCRKNGLVYSNLKEWTILYKDERCQNVTEVNEKVSKDNERIIAQQDEELQRLRKKVESLEKENQSITALLELKKKVESLYPDMSSEKEN